MLDRDLCDFLPAVFERFHAGFEALRRCIFADRRASFQELYGACISGENPAITLRPRDVLHLASHVCTAGEADVKKFAASIVLPALNNPGFDVLVLESDDRGSRFAVCIECRYSYPSSSTQISVEDIVEKYDLTIGELKSRFAELGLSSEKQVFLVVAAFRNITAAAITKKVYEKFASPNLKLKYASSGLMPNIVLLGKEELKRLYTPTLVSRPQFILEGMKR